MSTTKGSSGGNSIDAKREEFRKYLDKEGVLEYLTKQLVKLYEEADKPSNALDYLKNNFSGKDSEDVQLKADNLEKENIQLKERIKVLESEKGELELRLKELKSPAVAPQTVDNPKDIVEKTESDEDDPMETCDEKTDAKSVETSPLSPEPSKSDQVRSPARTENKDAAVVQTPKGIDEATNDKMDSDDSKGKVEGEESSTGDKSVDDENVERAEKIPEANE